MNQKHTQLTRCLDCAVVFTIDDYCITCTNKQKEIEKITRNECVEGWKEFFNRDEIECDQ